MQTAIVQLYSTDMATSKLDTFTYRFIRFKFNVEREQFETILFDAHRQRQEILRQFSKGILLNTLPGLQKLYGAC